MKMHPLTKITGITAALILSVSPTLSYAQAGGPPAGKPNIEERLAKMKTGLDLTDAQVAQLKTIFEDQKTALDAVFQDKSLTPDQRKAKAKTIRDSGKTKVQSVLTPEQLAKMKAIRKSKGDKKPN